MLTNYSEYDQPVIPHLYECILDILHASLWVGAEGETHVDVVHGDEE